MQERKVAFWVVLEGFVQGEDAEEQAVIWVSVWQQPTGGAFGVDAAGEVVAGLGSFGDVGVCRVALLRCGGSGC